MQSNSPVELPESVIVPALIETARIIVRGSVRVARLFTIKTHA